MKNVHCVQYRTDWCDYIISILWTADKRPTHPHVVIPKTHTHTHTHTHTGMHIVSWKIFYGASERLETWLALTGGVEGGG